MLKHTLLMAAAMLVLAIGYPAEAAQLRSGQGECSVLDLEILDNGNIGKQKVLFLVPDGTACVEDDAYVGNENFIKDVFAKVVISEGKYKGKSGWAPRQWLR